MEKYSDYLIDSIRKAKRTFGGDTANREHVVESLKFLYHCCVASERLLFDAGHEVTLDSESYHSFDWNLSEYYIRHLEEERGEIGVLVKDLASIGFDAVHSSPDSIAMGMIGSQYYLMKHVHPVCLLGYMAIQEADPTPLEAVKALEEAYGRDLFRFLRMHAVRDLEHRKELIELIDSAPEDKRALITMSTENALGYLEKFYGRW